MTLTKNVYSHCWYEQWCWKRGASAKPRGEPGCVNLLKLIHFCKVLSLNFFLYENKRCCCKEERVRGRRSIRGGGIAW